MAVVASRARVALAVVYRQVVQTQVISVDSARLLFVCEFVHGVVEHLVVSYATHPQAVVPSVVLLVVPSRVRLVHQLAAHAAHLVLGAGTRAARLLAVTLMPLSVGAIQGPRVVLAADVAAAEISPEVESITAMGISARVCVAVVTMAPCNTLNSLVGFLGCLAVISTMTLNLCPGPNTQSIAAVLETAHGTMGRQDMSLVPPRNFRRSQAV